MSHQVPDYYRYVSDITIVNPGSGYTSIPTITISGGGGTGATATASIFNGQIQAVNLTNSGEGYTAAPDVIVTGGGGSGAELTSKVAFASGTPAEYTEKSSLGVKFTLPEFVQNDYDKFVTFIEKYYEFMDSEGNPSNLLLNKDYHDIDELNSEELNKRALELAHHFPQILEADRKTLLKKIKNIYESKGSERSIKAYFKLLYNEEVEVSYPNILRTSDGVWVEETSARLIAGYNDYDVSNLSGRQVDIKYYSDRLETIEAVVTKIIKIAYTSPELYELVVDFPRGITSIPNSSNGEPPFIVDRGASSEEQNIRAYFRKTISSVVTNEYSGSDAGFSVGDIFFVNETQNNDCVIRVLTVDEFNVPVNWSIISPGKNFINDETTVTITSKKGVDLDITLITGYTFKYDGKFKDARGHLSTDFNRIQDNFKYQNYSYIIKTSISETQWAKKYKELIHPAGLNVFGDLIVTNNLNYAPFISVTNYGLHLFEFKTEDLVTNDDSFDRVVQWVRVFEDIPLATEEQVFATQKALVDTVGIIDSYDEFEYAGPDYLPENYVGSGVSKLIGKGLGDTATASEVLSPAMQFVRAFADDVANSTDSILLALNIGATLADSISEIADIQTVETGKNVSDIAGASDDYIQDYIEGGVLPEGYTGGGIFKLVEKVLTDSIVTSESFAPAVVYERVFTDNITKSDLFSITTLPDYSDEVVASDVFSYEKYRAVLVNDTLNSSDEVSISLENSFNNTLSSSEISVINIDKALVESQTTTDAVTLITEKPFTETSNVSDGGVVSIQDYAPTYFGEDYVGESYSF